LVLDDRPFAPMDAAGVLLDEKLVCATYAT